MDPTSMERAEMERAETELSRTDRTEVDPAEMELSQMEHTKEQSTKIERVFDLGEEGLIALFSGRGSSGPDIVVPNGDDAAAWQVPVGEVPVVSTDTLVEGVHFDLLWVDPRRLGRKLVAVNLSDLAAMGARPRHVLLSVAVPGNVRGSLIREVAEGVHAICAAHGVEVLGGNVSSSPATMVLMATVIGHAPPSRLVRRVGAEVADAVFVTGVLGDARAGLSCLKGEDEGVSDPTLVNAQLDPTPRVAAGLRLGELGVVHAMCDVSDGLSRDLPRLLRGAGLGASIDVRSLPISPSLSAFAARTHRSAHREALLGGEDYELLFTACPKDEPLIQEALKGIVPVRRIGAIDDSGRALAAMPDGQTIELSDGFGFSHYSSSLRLPSRTHGE